MEGVAQRQDRPRTCQLPGACVNLNELDSRPYGLDCLIDFGTRSCRSGLLNELCVIEDQSIMNVALYRRRRRRLSST